MIKFTHPEAVSSVENASFDVDRDDQLGVSVARGEVGRETNREKVVAVFHRPTKGTFLINNAKCGAADVLPNVIKCTKINID